MAGFEEISFAGYRCFRDPQTMPIGRLTLLYGPNSAGKTAAARVPSWMAESNTSAGTALAFGGTVVTGGWPGIVWRGPVGEHATAQLEIGVRWGGSSFRWNLDWWDVWDQPVPRSITAGPVTIEWIPRRDEREGPRTFRLRDEHVPIQVQGLCELEGAPAEMAGALRRLRDALAGVRLLASQRFGPSRTGLAPEEGASLNADGGGRERIMLDNEDIRAAVDAWYRRCGTRVQAAPLGDAERLVASASDGETWHVPFADVGEGLRHVFPVVVDLECLRKSGGILVVEEPEAHLHPTLQLALADLAVSVLEANPSAQVVFETHSEAFLLEAMLASATVPGLADGIRLNWFESSDDGSSRVEPIPIDDGRVANPRMREAFSHMGAMRRRVIDARRDAR